MSVRINISISKRLNEKLDQLSERWGVSKSSIVAQATGQYIDNLDRLNSVVFGDDQKEGLVNSAIKAMIESQDKEK